MEKWIIGILMTIFGGVIIMSFMTFGVRPITFESCKDLLRAQGYYVLAQGECIGSGLSPCSDSTINIGEVGREWKEGHYDELFSGNIVSDNGNYGNLFSDSIESTDGNIGTLTFATCDGVDMVLTGEGHIPILVFDDGTGGSLTLTGEGQIPTLVFDTGIGVDLTLTGDGNFEDIYFGEGSGNSVSVTDVYVDGGSIYLGDVTLTNTGSILDIDGQLVMHGDGLVYLEVQPDLDYGTIRANGKPTQVFRGVHSGFSLPNYTTGEELFVSLDVPREWDGKSDIIVHVHCYLPSEQYLTKYFKFQLDWSTYSPRDEELVPANSETVYVEVITDVSYTPEFQSYKADFTLDYDVFGLGNEIEPCDQLSMRLRRVTSTAPPASGEVVVTHIGVIFRRDKLGAPAN